MENWDSILQELQGRLSYADYWSSMPTCEICGDNHPTEYCQFNYNTGWQNYQNYPTYPPEPTYEDFSWYNNEIPAYHPEPYYPEYPPHYFEYPQEIQPVAEEVSKSDMEEIMELIRQNGEMLKNHEEMLNKRAAEIERMQAHRDELINNQSNPPPEILPENTENTEAELYTEPSQENTEPELYTETGVTCLDLPISINQLTDRELDEEIQMFFTEDMVEQIVENAVGPEERHEQIWEHNSDTTKEFPSHQGIVNFDQTSQKLDRMVLPFQVKHPTRPPDCLLLQSVLPRWENVGHASTSENFYLPPLLCNWDAVPTRESKATVKPP